MIKPFTLLGIPFVVTLTESLVHKNSTGKLRLHGSQYGLVAHDLDGVVVHEFPSPSEIKDWYA